jgi:hypothetical protein
MWQAAQFALNTFAPSAASAARAGLPKAKVKNETAKRITDNSFFNGFSSKKKCDSNLKRNFLNGLTLIKDKPLNHAKKAIFIYFKMLHT